MNWKDVALCGLLSGTSGCIIVGVRDKFVFNKSRSNSEGHFVPDFYIKNTNSRFYLPFVRVETSKLPDDLVLLTYDQTYENTSERFQSIVFDSILIEFSGGALKQIVSQESPVIERTFAVAKGSEVFWKKRKG